MRHFWKKDKRLCFIGCWVIVYSKETSRPMGWLNRGQYIIVLLLSKMHYQITPQGYSWKIIFRSSAGKTVVQPFRKAIAILMNRAIFRKLTEEDFLQKHLELEQKGTQFALRFIQSFEILIIGTLKLQKVRILRIVVIGSRLNV